MKRRYQVILLFLVLAMVQLACNMPAPGSGSGTLTPGGPTATFTLPPVVTATTAPGANNPTAVVVTATKASPSQPTATTRPSSGCTYKITFLGDITIPDNSTIAAGQSFTKTWRVRNDGTCTWGSDNHNLHALAYTSGNQLGAPNEVDLPGQVSPGQSVDISVNMKAPTTAGTYISNWLFRVDGDPSGRHWVGIGSSGNEPIYALIKVAGSSGGTTSNTTRLSFKAGATAINVNSSVKAGATKGYVLAAQKDQIILAQLSSAETDIKVKITASNGTALSGATGQDGTYAMVALPSTQDYIVWVTGGASDASFSMSITIPSRITFDPGAISATVNGKVSDHMNVSYILRASGGQTMNVTLTGEDVGLTIYGLKDGQPLVRAEGGATSFNGVLPATQDYILIAVPAVDSTTFTMKVTVK